MGRHGGALGDRSQGDARRGRRKRPLEHPKSVSERSDREEVLGEGELTATHEAVGGVVATTDAVREAVAE